MSSIFIILLGIFLIYNIVMIIIDGVPASLSDTFYKLPESWRVPFWFVMFIFWALASMIIGQSGWMFGVNVELLEAAKYFKNMYDNCDKFFGSEIMNYEKHNRAITNAEKQMKP